MMGKIFCANCAYCNRPLYKSPCSECYGRSKWEAKEKPITNADHIRSMSDEELAEFLTDYKAEISRGLGVHYSDTSLYKEAALNFLKQPWKENTNGRKE
jgi:hypothetical protein